MKYRRCPSLRWTQCILYSILFSTEGRICLALLLIKSLITASWFINLQFLRRTFSSFIPWKWTQNITLTLFMSTLATFQMKSMKDGFSNDSTSNKPTSYLASGNHIWCDQYYLCLVLAGSGFSLSGPFYIFAFCSVVQISFSVFTNILELHWWQWWNPCEVVEETEMKKFSSST